MKRTFSVKLLLFCSLILGFNACVDVDKALINTEKPAFSQSQTSQSNTNVSVTIPDAGEVEAFRKQIASIGCKIVGQSEPPADSMSPEEILMWQKEQFNVDYKISFLAKCRAADKLLYQFLFQKENYKDEADAVKRLPRIHDIPPNEHDKSYFAVPVILREGFRIKNKIYTVGTFTMKLEAEGDVKRWQQKLEKAVQ